MEKIYFVLCTGNRYYFNNREENDVIDELQKEKVLEKLYCTHNESLSVENYTIYKVNYNKI